MKMRKSLFLVLLILCMVWVSSAAYAENIALESPSSNNGGNDKNNESAFSSIGETLFYVLLGGSAAVVGVKIYREHNNGGHGSHGASSDSKNSGDNTVDPNITQPLPTQPWLDPSWKQPTPLGDLYLSCRGGYQDGREYPLKAEILIGRATDCDIRYPDDCPGISRHHAIVRCYEELGSIRVELTDTSSTETYLKKGSIGENKANQIPKNTPIELRPGDVFYIGARENRFELVQKVLPE